MRALTVLLLLATTAAPSEFSELTARIKGEGDRGRLIELSAAAIAAWTPADGRDNLHVTLTDMGYLLMQEDLPEEAIRFYDQALKMKPQDWTSLNNRANGRMRMHRYDSALPDLLAAYRLKPDAQMVLMSLCGAYGALDRWTDAIGYCEEQVRLQPEYVMSLRNLAIAYASLGRHAEAAAVMARVPGSKNLGDVFAVDRWKYDPDRRVAEAVIPALAGDWDKGETLLGELIRDHPKLPHACYWRGRLRLARGRYEPATKDFDLALRIDPRFVEALVWRAFANDKAGYPISAAEDRAKACAAGWAAACPKKKRRS